MFARALLLSAITLALAAATALASGGGGGGDEENWSFKPGDFRQGYAAIEAKDYARAIEWFAKAAAADPKDADAVNYLGYSHRKLGEFETALKFYRKALELDPKHKGAHEYLGEAYLEMNDLPKAKEQLARLDDLCWLGCKEYSDLKSAVRKYEQSRKS